MHNDNRRLFEIQAMLPTRKVLTMKSIALMIALSPVLIIIGTIWAYALVVLYMRESVFHEQH
jgi:hypothetical protein